MTKIVFVHLGKKVPKVLLANLARCKKLFPRITISVIGDSSKLLAKVGKYCDSTYLFTPDDNLKISLNPNSHDLNFRDGFWLKTTLRLFAVTKYVQEKEIHSCLHLESDVLLSSDFPFHKFENLHKLSWSKFNSNHDVAAIFFVPNPGVAKEFDKRFLQILSENPGLTDMTGLSKFGQQFPELIEYLPSTESHESELFSDRNVLKSDRELMAKNFSYFGGIFDSAPIGMWTLGQDPRNHRGLLKRNISLPESFINPSAVKCNVTSDSKLNVRPKGNYVQGFSLFSLHVHSKNYKVFTTVSTHILMKFFKTSSINKQLTTFHPTIFVQCIFKGVKRRLLGVARKLNL